MVAYRIFYGRANRQTLTFVDWRVSMSCRVAGVGPTDSNVIVSVSASAACT
jgi:hypothetical protein